MRPLIIFDFDGTIADSVDAIVDAANALAQEKGYKEGVSREDLRERPIRSAMRKMKVPFWRVPGFIKQLYERITPRITRINLHPHIAKILKRLSKEADLAIVSGNRPAIIDAFLKDKGLKKYFPVVEGDIIFGKNRRIKKVRKSYGLPKDHVLMIGDETRDIHGARRAGVESLAVTWGVNSEDVLIRARPTYMARTGNELEELLKAWLSSRVSA